MRSNSSEVRGQHCGHIELDSQPRNMRRPEPEGGRGNALAGNDTAVPRYLRMTGRPRCERRPRSSRRRPKSASTPPFCASVEGKSIRPCSRGKPAAITWSASSRPSPSAPPRHCARGHAILLQRFVQLGIQEGKRRHWRSNAFGLQSRGFSKAPIFNALDVGQIWNTTHIRQLVMTAGRAPRWPGPKRSKVSSGCSMPN